MLCFLVAVQFDFVPGWFPPRIMLQYAMAPRNQTSRIGPILQPTWIRRLAVLRQASPPDILLNRLFDDTYDFPRSTIRPSTYLIAATPRSGSHYLGHLLFATRQLGAPLEYLEALAYRRWSQIADSKDPSVVLREIMARRTSPSGWFGMQAHWFHMAHLSRLKVPREIFDFHRIIWIRRRDLIEQAVSFAIMLQTGAPSSFHKPSREPVYNYQAIADCAEAITHMNQEWAQFMMQTSIPILSLYYEDIRANEMKTIGEILDWFGLPPLDVPISIPLQKQSTETNAAWKDRFLHDMRRLETHRIADRRSLR
jgi:LPS sulfotransferase NodH